MKLHRFIIQDINLGEQNITITDEHIVHQLTRVLRCSIGTHIIVCNGASREAELVITGITKRSVTARLERSFMNDREPTHSVTLYCSVIKHEHFAMVVEKATEVGVSAIVPIITARSVKVGLKLDRLRTIAKEAAEQSGRGIVPIIHPIMTFEEALNDAQRNDQNFFFDVGADLLIMQSVQKESAARFGLCIGPEGGWDDTERRLAHDGGMIVGGLGTLTLRAETAAIVATYLAVNILRK